MSDKEIATEAKQFGVDELYRRINERVAAQIAKHLLCPYGPKPVECDPDYIARRSEEHG